jgi:hypothetical protein
VERRSPSRRGPPGRLRCRGFSRPRQEQLPDGLVAASPTRNVVVVDVAGVASQPVAPHRVSTLQPLHHSADEATVAVAPGRVRRQERVPHLVILHTASVAAKNLKSFLKFIFKI